MVIKWNDLFFEPTRRSRYKQYIQIDYKDFKKYHNSSKNGLSDIYWMDAKIIEKFQGVE